MSVRKTLLKLYYAVFGVVFCKEDREEKERGEERGKEEEEEEGRKKPSLRTVEVQLRLSAVI